MKVTNLALSFIILDIKYVLKNENVLVTSQVLLWPSNIDPEIKYSGDGHSRTSFRDG